MEIEDAARRHGISDDAIRHARTNAIVVRRVEDGVLLIGGDETGRLIELLARETRSGLSVFHANSLTSKYRRYLP